LNQQFVEDAMNIFSDEIVDSLSDDEVKKIAAESPAERKNRRRLREEILRLEKVIKESDAILARPMTA
jgi:hypothetical protein